MIVVSNNEQTILVSISLSIGHRINLKFLRDCTMDAILLRNQIQKDLNNKIEQIRKDAYNKGWRDAKSKKVAKQTWFNSNINSD